MSPVLSVADLSREHAGWLVRIDDPETIKGYREVVVIGSRSWEYEGVEYVGVLTDEGQREGWAGTERKYAATTPCEPLRIVKKTKRWRAS